LILHRLTVAFSLIGTTLLTVVILFFTWYKTLPPPSDPPSEDMENLEERLDGVQDARSEA
jgi:hypothetical protein